MERMLDDERIGRMRHADEPVRASRMGQFVRAKGTGRVRAHRGGGGITVVYTIILIDSIDIFFYILNREAKSVHVIAIISSRSIT
jgi:hypothetical protein